MSKEGTCAFYLPLSQSGFCKQLADARKEGKHALLFRVKSGEGTRFVALPLGNA